MTHNYGYWCALCGGAIVDEDLDTVHAMDQVTGYERKREAGGTNALALRRTTGKKAHSTCVRSEQRGVSARQGDLL